MPTYAVAPVNNSQVPAAGSASIVLLTFTASDNGNPWSFFNQPNLPQSFSPQGIIADTRNVASGNDVIFTVGGIIPFEITLQSDLYQTYMVPAYQQPVFTINGLGADDIVIIYAVNFPLFPQEYGGSVVVDLSSPGPIGNSVPNSGTFTAIQCDGTINATSLIETPGSLYAGSAINTGGTIDSGSITSSGTVFAAVLSSGGLIETPGTIYAGSEFTTPGTIYAGAISSTGAISATTLIASSGSITCSGNITASNFYLSSDVRLKQNIDYLPGNSIDVITALTPRTYVIGGKQSEGFIAQEVERIPLLRHLVHTDAATGLKSLDYVSLIAWIVRAIKIMYIKGV